MGGVVSSILGGGKTPSVSTVAPDNSAEVKAAEDKQRRLAAAARGRSSTLLTNPEVLGEASTAKKTLLGS